MQFEKHIFYDLIFLGIDSLYITDAAETPLSRLENNRIARTIQTIIVRSSLTQW